MKSNTGMGQATPLQFREMQASYVLKDGSGGRLLIKNVTERGMGCECGTVSLDMGDEIGVDLPFLGLRAGVVRWVKTGSFGIQMAQPLDVDCLRLYSNT